jgi:hypothetical protein
MKGISGNKGIHKLIVIYVLRAQEGLSQFTPAVHTLFYARLRPKTLTFNKN